VTLLGRVDTVGGGGLVGASVSLRFCNYSLINRIDLVPPKPENSPKSGDFLIFALIWCALESKMKTYMQVAMWVTMIICLLATLPLAWLGLEYAHGTGQGLHPALSAIGVAMFLALGFSAAHIIDSPDL
jgi:hypothetical protein